ncbi:uncharacterized protein LY89DRAFT_60414 [Mollisia scopiformis]|uniref:NACHT domain-containing protein n=1 Tax=Mollisia scopiformis TaxID=149040 RepID=A0A194XD98_MOLSC|nr:uncharacterized protein LY89DRAFT_60414 [Mollisia scopiformis]KUJ17727.1 hypothetical protein LY89DRAFT_60414 [Mollisia scopiformis]
MSIDRDAWTIAKERYLSDLEPADRLLFHEATIENLYYDTSVTNATDRKSSKIHRAIEAVQPLVDKIESYGKAMDTFTNISPTFVAPIWGSIRVELVMAKGLGRIFEKLTECLGRIGDILPRLLDYQRIFSTAKHPRLTEAVARTYLDIIELCMDFKSMIKGQQRNPLKRVVHSPSMEHKFKDAEARFRAHRKAVEKEAETCHMIEAAEARALVLRDRQLQEMNNKAQTKLKVLKLLSNINSQQKHQKVRKIRHADTGNWLFATQEYRSWMDSKSSTAFCCYGIPGCGKTVLASSVIDSLVATAESRSLAITYHYCDYADKRTLDPITILGALARNLLESIDIPEPVLELVFEIYREGERIPESKEVLEIFSRTIDSFDHVAIVVDGIDEVNEEDRQGVYDALKVLVGGHTAPIKLFMSCRENILAAISTKPASSFRVQISEATTSTDIQGYVRNEVSSLIRNGDLVIRKSILEKAIVEALIAGAKGMFLWVKFQLDELCTAESDDAIMYTLQHLPKDLSETYDRLLGRIVGVQRQELVKRMFRWIICARRPLVVDELCEGIAFTIDDTR